MEYAERLEKWINKHEEDESLKFENLETKFNECKQVSAIVFLASKLKDKNERFFLHGEHDTLYIGSGFDVFEEFTEEDVKILISHDLYISDCDGGFQMYASM